MAIQAWANSIDDAGAWLYHPVRPLTYTTLDMEIVFVLDGELEVKRGRDIRKLKQADITLINPPSSGYERVFAQPTWIRPTRDCYFLLLRLSSSFLSTVFQGVIPVFDCDSGSRSGNYAGLRSVLAEIASADTAGPEKGLMFYSRLYRLLDELKLHFTAEKEEADKETQEEGKRRQMIYSYIKKNFRGSISLDDIADSFSLTPQYFSKYFKKTFGVNFHAYIKKIRLESALKELSATNKSVTTIAADNGFPNPSALIQGMKETVRQTPTSYRRAYQAEMQEKDSRAEKMLQRIDPDAIRDKLAPFIAGNTATPDKPKKISTDAHDGFPLTKTWQEVINLGFAADFEKSEFIKQVKILQSEAPFRYARFQGLFGRSMIIPNDAAEYSFAKIDRMIDFLYSVDLLPFIELGFKPAKVNKNTNTLVFSKDDEIDFFPITEYERIIGNFLKHAINRYGMGEVSQWQFEYWESRNDQQLFLDDIDTYIDQFSRIRGTIKKILPGARVGGPGLSMVKPGDAEYVNKLIKGLRAKNNLPDFFSCYIFNMDTLDGTAEVEGGQLILLDKNGIVKEIEETKEVGARLCGPGEFGTKSEFHERPFYITEWNFDFSCRNLIHDSLFKAPFIIKNSIDIIDNIDVLAYWLASDISAEYTDSDAPLFGGPGLISRNGIRKPAFFAYQFLSKLGGRLLSKGEGYIITAKADDEFAVILFNYKYIADRIRFMEQLWYISGSPSDFLEDTEKCPVSLEIRNINSGRYKIRQHILNSDYGSVYDTWAGLSSIQNLQTGEMEWLERTCFPDLRIDFLSAKDSLTIDCELEPNEVRLLEISRILE
jgi:beta-xylosidase/AraC-like DNA-binding protein